MGIIVPRHGRSAVERNRLKRRLREIVRQDVLPAERGVDLIVRTAPAAYSVTFDDLRSELDAAFRRVVN